MMPSFCNGIPHLNHQFYRGATIEAKPAIGRIRRLLLARGADLHGGGNGVACSGIGRGI